MEEKDFQEQVLELEELVISDIEQLELDQLDAQLIYEHCVE